MNRRTDAVLLMVVSIDEAAFRWGKCSGAVEMALWKDQLEGVKSGIWIVSVSSLIRRWGMPKKTHGDYEMYVETRPKKKLPKKA